MTLPPLVLGVDGGGTKTQAWLARVDDQGFANVIGQGISGSSNQVAVGLKPAFENLAKAIELACTEAKLSSTGISSGVFALAGSGTDEARQQILDFIQLRFQISTVEVIHDGQAVLEAGTPDSWGIALIAGTGTVAYGKNQQGETATVGGWGYWFGDEGSAYWIGQAALRAIAQAADGRAPQTALTSAVLSRLKIQDPREILSVISKQGGTRLAIANLAALTCTVAAQEDEVANLILNQTVRHWCNHIACLAKQLAISDPFPIAFAGGVLCGNKYARGLFRKRLAKEEIVPASEELVSDPVYGCVLMAQRILPSA